MIANTQNREAKEDKKKVQRKKPIACLSWTTSTGETMPLSIKLEDENGKIRTLNKIRVIKITRKEELSLPFYDYEVELLVNGLTIKTMLEYVPKTTSWYIYTGL